MTGWPASPLPRAGFFGLEDTQVWGTNMGRGKKAEALTVVCTVNSEMLKKMWMEDWILKRKCLGVHIICNKARIYEHLP